MPKKAELKCYFGCAVDGPLHRFPKWLYPHEERFNSWKAVLNLLTQEKGNEFIFNNIRLCYRHFEDYYQLPSHRLTGNAIPTLNLTTNLQHQLELQILREMPSMSQRTPLSSQVEIQTTLESNVKKQSAHSHYTRTGHNILPEECNNTADLLLKIDQLFDSFNGHSYNNEIKKYRVCLKNNSPDIKLWNEMLPILKSMGFETKKKDGTLFFRKVPSINNFIKNIITYKEMWQYLNKEYKVTSVFTRNLNPDPVETFFCKIRSSGVRNVNPSYDQFLSSYKTLMINNLATPHSVNANCEDDETSLLQSHEYLLTEAITEEQDSRCQDLLPINSLIEDLASTSSTRSRDSFINLEKKSNVAGSIILKNISEHDPSFKKFITILSMNIILHMVELKGKLVTFIERDETKKQAYKYYKDCLKIK